MKPVKHLSRAVRFGDLVYVAGTTGRDMITDELPKDVTEQTRVALENIKMTLKSAGTSLGNTLKMSCYLADLADKPAFDGVYLDFFPTDRPARACLEVASLAPGIKMEIEAIADMPEWGT